MTSNAAEPLTLRRIPQRPRARRQGTPGQHPLPFDSGPSSQGSLALSPSTVWPEDAVGRPSLHVVPPPPPGISRGTGLESRAMRFVQALVEVSGGNRPIHQLSRWMNAQTYDTLVERLSSLAQTRSVTGPASPGPRARVVSVRVNRPTERSAEISARIVQGERSRALAARIELCPDHKGHGRWICTALVWG